MFCFRRLALILALTTGLTALVASAAGAKTLTQTARSGSLSASFSFDFTSSDQSYADGLLTIRSDGSVQYRQPVDAPLCRKLCEPGVPSSDGSSLSWRHLTSSGQPQLVLDLYAGGAHCCTVVEILSQARGSDHWSLSAHDFGDPGFQLADLNHDGGDEFVSADDRFAYAFTDYAASGMPLQILRWSGGRFIDVTRSYPARLARDAARWMGYFTQQKKTHYDDTTGVIAAWAADEDALGRSGFVASFLKRAAAAHELNSGLGESSNAKYIGVLDRFLRKTGYLR